MDRGFRVEPTERGLAIYLDGSVVAGFLSILLDAKFQPGIRSEVLLTPWIRQIVEAYEQLSGPDESILAPPDVQARVEQAIDSYVAAHHPPESREELIRLALLPFQPN